MRTAGNELRQAGKGMSERVKKEPARRRSGRKKGGRGRGREVGVLDPDLHMSMLNLVEAAQLWHRTGQVVCPQRKGWSKEVVSYILQDA